MAERFDLGVLDGVTVEGIVYEPSDGFPAQTVGTLHISGRQAHLDVALLKGDKGDRGEPGRNALLGECEDVEGTPKDYASLLFINGKWRPACKEVLGSSGFSGSVHGMRVLDEMTVGSVVRACAFGVVRVRAPQTTGVWVGVTSSSLPAGNWYGVGYQPAGCDGVVAITPLPKTHAVEDIEFQCVVMPERAVRDAFDVEVVDMGVEVEYVC